MNKNHLSKIGFIFIILVFGLIHISVSYSGFTDSLHLEGTVTTTEDFNFLNLRGYWSFDDEQNPGKDYSSYNQQGTCFDVSWTLNGKQNGAIYFNGDSAFIDVGYIETPSNSFTVMAWVKPEEYKENMQIIAQGYNGIHTPWELKTVTDENHLDFRRYTNGIGAIGVQSETPVDIGEWTHVAGVYNKSLGVWKIYINGYLDNETGADGPVSLTTPTYIGAVYHGGMTPAQPVQFWHGLIDEVKLYTCELSQEEIQIHMIS